MRRRNIYGPSDELWREAKSAAAADGKTLSDWIAEAIEEKIERRNAMKLTNFLATAIQNGQYDEDDGCIFFCSDEDCTKFRLGTNDVRAFVICIGEEIIQEYTKPEMIEEAIREGLVNEVASSDPNNILVAQCIDPRTGEIKSG